MSSCSSQYWYNGQRLLDNFSLAYYNIPDGAVIESCMPCPIITAQCVGSNPVWAAILSLMLREHNAGLEQRNALVAANTGVMHPNAMFNKSHEGFVINLRRARKYLPAAILSLNDVADAQNLIQL